MPADVANPNAAPIDVPEGIAPEKERPASEGVAATGIGNEVGVIGGVPGGIFTGTQPIAAPPPPPPPAAKVDDTPRRVGSLIKAPERIAAAPPVYPPLALTARVEGDVILEAVIGSDGRVRDVRVLRSVQLLDEAAVEAVKRWRYTPTRLNGIPVPVIMTVTVSFRLR
jgi:protein TonB